MKRRILFSLLALALTFGLGIWFAGTRQQYQTDRADRAVVATVSGQAISQADLNSRMIAYRKRALLDVILQKRIMQEAGLKKVVVSPEEVKFPPGPLTPEQATTVGFQVWTEAMLTKLILQEWPDQRLRQLFQDFHDDWVEFDVGYFALADPGDRAALAVDQQDNVDFANLAPRYSDWQKQGRQQLRGWFSRASLEERFGPSAARQIMSSKVQRWFGPLQIGEDLLVFKVFSLREDFESLRPGIQARLVQGRRAAYLQELLKNSTLTVTPELGGNLEALRARP